MTHSKTSIALLIASLGLLSACGGSGSGSGVNDSAGGTQMTAPTQFAGSDVGEILVLSNRSDLLSEGNALVEITAVDPSNLSDISVFLNTDEVSEQFAVRSDGRLMGKVEGMQIGENTLRVVLADGQELGKTLVNHPNGGPIFSGPQIGPYTCQGSALDATQCSQAPTFEFKYMPSERVQPLLAGADVEGQRLGPSLLPYDPENPPADEDIRMTTTQTGETVPFIVRIERGYQNRNQYQIMSLFQPGMDWNAFDPQPQWNRKLLIHHGGNVGVSYGPSSPPNGDISGTAPDGFEFALGDSITVALSKGFVTLSTTWSNLGRNTNLVTSAESLVMAKEYIIENYGELNYTIGTGCSGGAIAQQHVANAYPGIYQGIIIQCSYPDVWTTATQFGDYNLLNSTFGYRFDETFLNLEDKFAAGPAALTETPIPLLQWSLFFGHGPVNPAASDLAFFPSAYPTQPSCRGLGDGIAQYSKDNPTGVRCGLFDYMINQFGPRLPAVWNEQEQAAGRGFTGIPFDNQGVQYGLRALQAGLITEDQFVAVNRDIGGFNLDVERVAERTPADLEALERAYKTGAINTAEHLKTTPMIDLRGADPGIAHDAFHSWQIRARMDAAYGHHDNQVIWFGQVPLAGDSTYSTEALFVMDRWLASIAADEDASTSLEEKVRLNKPTEARDRCLSAQSLYSPDGPVVPTTGNIFFGTPLIEQLDSSQAPTLDPEQGLIFDQAANQVCGLDFSMFDPTGQSQQLTGPVAMTQELLVQTRFGTPRTVAGDDIRTLTNKCVLKPIDAADYASPVVADPQALADRMSEIFPEGVCDYTQDGPWEISTQTWQHYGTADEHVYGGEPLPAVPSGSMSGWGAKAFGF